jgi:hypothetical protein
VEWQGVASTVVTVTRKSLDRQRLQIKILAAYERLADSVEKTRGHDSRMVKKVKAIAIRDDLVDRGHLGKDDDTGKVTGAARKQFDRAKEDLIDDGLMVETAGLIRKIRDF